MIQWRVLEYVVDLTYLHKKLQLPHFFFFTDTATTEIYTLSLHDALPICRSHAWLVRAATWVVRTRGRERRRSEEHTSELQSHVNLVCRLLLEKKKMRVLYPHIAKDKLCG